MEEVQVKTLKSGNGYDIPVQGSRVSVDYRIWASDHDQPSNDYKGKLEPVDDPGVEAMRAGITDFDIVNIYVREMSVGEKIRVHHPKGNVFEIELCDILENSDEGMGAATALEAV